VTSAWLVSENNTKHFAKVHMWGH